MDNYQLQLLQTGRYVKVVGGEVLGEATSGELRCYFLQKKFPAVEVGFLEVALALAGVTGIISTISTSPVVQFLSVAAFFFSVIGAYNLTWLYIQPRIPIAWTHYLTSPFVQRHVWFPFTIWLFFYSLEKRFILVSLAKMVRINYWKRATSCS